MRRRPALKWCPTREALEGVIQGGVGVLNDAGLLVQAELGDGAQGRQHNLHHVPNALNIGAKLCS